MCWLLFSAWSRTSSWHGTSASKNDSWSEDDATSAASPVGFSQRTHGLLCRLNQLDTACKVVRSPQLRVCAATFQSPCDDISSLWPPSCEDPAFHWLPDLDLDIPLSAVHSLIKVRISCFTQAHNYTHDQIISKSSVTGVCKQPHTFLIILSPATLCPAKFDIHLFRLITNGLVLLTPAPIQESSNGYYPQEKFPCPWLIRKFQLLLVLDSVILPVKPLMLTLCFGMLRPIALWNGANKHCSIFSDIL